MKSRRRTAAELESVQTSLRRLSRQTANVQFRDSLRAQFVRDAIPRPEGAPGRAGWWYAPWRIAAAVASIAALTLGSGWLLNRGAAWRLTSASGSGALQIDGRAVALDASDEIAHRLKPGADVWLP